MSDLTKDSVLEIFRLIREDDELKMEFFDIIAESHDYVADLLESDNVDNDYSDDDDDIDIINADENATDKNQLYNVENFETLMDNDID